MKFAAAFLLFVWGSLIVQPSFAYFGGKSAYGKCDKAAATKSPCSKSRSATSGCSKKNTANKPCPKKSDNKSSNSEGNCKSEGCNPTLGCSSGNFYVHHYAQISLPARSGQKQQSLVVNDNRIVRNMRECWHPPEA